MPAVRLRGQDAINRALEVHQRHTQGGETITDLAQHYQASTEAVRQWLHLARKHTLPDLDDADAWVKKIVSDWGARLEDAKDADAVRLGEALSKMLGVGSAEELAAQRVRIEAAKVALVAEAFDRVIAGLDNRDELRSRFVTAMREVEA